jgi:hypothetical protein
MLILFAGQIFQGLRMSSMFVLNFVSKLGKTFLETLKMLKQAFGDKALSRTQTHEWHIHFKDGKTSIDGTEHSG